MTTANFSKVGRRGFATGVLGGALAAMVAGVAQAQPRIQTPGGGPNLQPSPQGGVINGVNPEAMAQAMAQSGYSDVEIKKTDKGEPFVVGKSGQTQVYTHFQNCENGSCIFAVMRAYLGKQADVDLNFINAWNMRYLTTKLFNSTDGELVFQLAFRPSGVTPTFLKTHAEMFASTLPELMKFDPTKVS